MKIRQIAVVLIALLAAAVIVGCGGTSTDNEKTSGSIVFDSTNTTTDLRIIFGTGVNQQLFQANGREPSFRRDGQVIAFIGAFDVDANDIFAYNVCIINSDGTGLVELTDNAESADPTVSNPAVSPDGEKVAYVTGGAIHLVDADGANDAQLVADAYNPAFSPDGEQIAFVRVSDIFTINLDDKVETNVTNNTSGDLVSSPEFSPSGDEIVYALHTTIMLLDIAGATQEDIVTNGAHPTFKPDATRIAFVRDNMIYSVNIAGTDLQQLTTVTDQVHNNPSWAATP